MAVERSDPPRNSLWIGVGVTGVALDAAHGAYYVATRDDSVEYVDRITGAVLRATLMGGSTGLSGPRQPALGPDGELVVPNFNSGTVTIYPAGAAGDTPPSPVLANGLAQPLAVTVDAQGFIYTANYGGDSITVHAPGASNNDAPVRTVQGPATGLNQPTSVVLDQAGRLYVTNFAGTVTVYPAGADGNAAPSRTISDGDSLVGAESAALDSSGHVYVALLQGEVLVFASGADGPSTPLVRLSGPDTGLQTSLDLLVEPDRAVTVANDEPHTVTTYDPLMPFTAPSKPRSLVVRGTADAPRRTVDWRAPADDGGRPVSAYDLVVTKAGRTVLTRTVHDTDTVLRRSDLPRGSLTVKVRARNVVGVGPAASRDFTVRR